MRVLAGRALRMALLEWLYLPAAEATHGSFLADHLRAIGTSPSPGPPSRPEE
jgi:hypothetical protein